MRRYDEYTEEGLVALGEAVSYWRRAEKPHWQPQVTEGLSEKDIILERLLPWSMQKLAEILNREYGLETRPVTFGVLQRLETPPENRQEVGPRLIELIAGLEIMINPATEKPFTDADLRAIAKGLLDWKTGLPATANKASDSCRAV